MNYPLILHEMWEQAQVVRASNAPTVISTFAGGGGSSLGYLAASYRELLAVEWDKNAVDTLRLNFPSLDIYHGDIARLSIDEILERTGLKPGELDVLDGSPPCQGFSTAGKRDLHDVRNQLFREYIRLLRGLMPKVFVMENVGGMVKGKMKLIFSEIIRGLKESGYSVSARLMNAKYFGVPQNRERIIFIGVRDDLNILPSHPSPPSWGFLVNPRIAWIDCPLEDAGDHRPMKDWLKEAAKFIEAGNYNHRSVERAFLKVRGSKAGSMNTKLLSWDRVSCCLVKSEIGDTGIIHPSRERYLTIPEAKRLGAFPDEYQLVGVRKEKWARIGNSVPPLFMRAIALHIREDILSHCKTESEKRAVLLERVGGFA